jgi:lipase ATG15
MPTRASFFSYRMSAPNAILSRDTFDPPLTIEQLNTFTLNVVPARDLVPMIDDKAMLYQNINCTADRNDIAGCHSIVRSLCEIQFSCGSDGRPVLCGKTAYLLLAFTAMPSHNFILQCRMRFGLQV